MILFQNELEALVGQNTQQSSLPAGRQAKL
jgi:hypothetical protein